MENSTKGFEPIDPTVLEERFLLEFNHTINDRSARLKVFLRPYNAMRGLMWNIVIENNEEEVARVRGRLTKSEDDVTEFLVESSDNLSKSGSSRNHIPRAVGASISQLVSKGIIDRWYSDKETALSNDAKNLYRQYLSRDTRLTVTPPDAKTAHRYIVVANREVL